ncbi:MAG: hypothetical protein M3Y53_07780 [Thermoproteota archaeon]|nr:hypothetical protein [Thermoproteota archaeon]
MTTISLGPKKVILVGYLNPLRTSSALRLGSRIVGPLGEGRPTSGYFGAKAFAR